MYSGCRVASRAFFAVNLLFAGLVFVSEAAADPSTLRVDYVGSDSHVREFYVSDGTWQDFDLTAATGDRKPCRKRRSPMWSIRLKM